MQIRLFHFSLVALFVTTFISSYSVAQTTLAFQGGEVGDTWNYLSTPASAIALSGRTLAGNHVSGLTSLVVGGNSGGGNCLSSGSGNGTFTNSTINFSAIDISSSSNFTRTLKFNYGNYLPACNGTGWDTGDDLSFTAILDGVAQSTIIIVAGAGDVSFPIQTNVFTYSIPACVLNFAFEINFIANRADEFLYIDNVSLTTTDVNPTIPNTSAIVGNQTVCLGGTETYSINSIPNASYTWSGLPIGASFTTPNGTTNSNSITVNWGTASAGTYTLEVTPSIANCTTTSNGTTSTISVTIGGTSTLSMSPNVTICAGETTTISVNETGVFSWNNSLGNGSTFQVNPSTTTTYIATGTLNGCQANGSMIVTVTPLPILSLSADNQTICTGNTAIISAFGADTYVWNPSASILNITTNSISVSPTATETFSVIGTRNGCDASANITINVSTGIPIEAGTNASICAGESITLTASGGTNYTWDNGITNGVPFTPTQTTTYTVTGNNASGCSGTDQVTIIVSEIPTATISSDVQTGCIPLEVNFTAQTDAGNTVTWIFPNGTTTGITTENTFTSTNCSDLEVVVNNGVCSQTYTFPNYICPSPSPIAAFNLNLSELETGLNTVNTTNLSENASSYSWNFGDGTADTTDFEPSHNYTELNSEGYWIHLTATNNAGCTDEDSVFISVKQANELIYFIPNSFTPNGDEFNQTFLPIFTSGYSPATYHFTIYDRWGQILFESKDPTIGWNGTNFRGEQVNIGTYVWSIEFGILGNDDRRKIQGNLNLFR